MLRLILRRECAGFCAASTGPLEVVLGDLFRGISQIKLTTDGTGVDVAIHITKKDGVPVRLAAEGEDPQAVIAVRRVNDTDYYCYNAKALAAKVGLSINKLVALIKFMVLVLQLLVAGRSDTSCYGCNREYPSAILAAAATVYEWLPLISAACKCVYV